MALPVWRATVDRLLGAAPRPPGGRLLEGPRRRLVRALLHAHRGEIAALRSAYARSPRAGRGDDQAPVRLAALAESLVAELRRRLPAESAPPLGTQLAWLDGLLPTPELELMDRAEHDESRRAALVLGVDAWSRRFGSYRRFARLLQPLLPARGTATLLDLASGACGFPLALAGARTGGVRLRVTASDARPEYLALGRERARAEGAADLDFLELDAAALERWPARRRFDLITCVQSLHHFGPGATAVLLAGAARRARRGLLFVDLCRSLSGLLAFAAFGRLAGVDRDLRHDSLLSMRRAFAPEELELLAGCVPGGERLEVLRVPPGFVALRTRPEAA